MFRRKRASAAARPLLPQSPAVGVSMSPICFFERLLFHDDRHPKQPQDQHRYHDKRESIPRADQENEMRALREPRSSRKSQVTDTRTDPHQPTPRPTALVLKRLRHQYAPRVRRNNTTTKTTHLRGKNKKPGDQAPGHAINLKRNENSKSRATPASRRRPLSSSRSPLR